MGLLYLIADLMRSVLNAPFRILQGIGLWRAQRMALQRTALDVTKEAKEARGVKGFFKLMTGNAIDPQEAGKHAQVAL